MHTHGTHSHMCTHACGRHTCTLMHTADTHVRTHPHTRLCPALREGKGVRDPHSLAPGGGAVGAVPPEGPRVRGSAGWAPARHTAAARTDQGGGSVSQESVNTPPPAARWRPQRPRPRRGPCQPRTSAPPGSLVRPPLSPRPTGGSSRRGEEEEEARAEGSFGSGDPFCGGLGVRGPRAPDGSCRRSRASPQPQPHHAHSPGGGSGGGALAPSTSGTLAGSFPPLSPQPAPPLLQVASRETAPGLPFHLRPGGFSHRSWVPSPQAAPRRVGRTRTLCTFIPFPPPAPP